MTTPKIYVARAGKYGEDEDFALSNNVAIVGFRDVPSLELAHTYEDVLAIVTAAMPGEKPRALGNIAGQLWAFRLAMSDGDIIVLPKKTSPEIALGLVDGPYAYQKIGDDWRHTRKVRWQRTVPRTSFQQDLLFSFGAFLTVCNISRNEAASRVASALATGRDPGPVQAVTARANKFQTEIAGAVSDSAAETTDIAQLAHDQVVAHIQTQFSGHGLAALVEAILRAEGWQTRLSPPGVDGGVDILAGRGSLGLEPPRVAVQVKSQTSPTDVNVYRNLQGAMQTFKADHGLLVCWGGFNRAVLAEARTSHFAVRLWDSNDVVQALYRNYDKLPAEMQAAVPLKRTWMLVLEDSA